ncbi:MAG: glycoside hydrolase family 16 protein, partial [Desulfobacteraceae bacterium]|nr:glycoside hydrolase family 16 protein [Desulfobacteraceae bacterium]
PTIEEKQNSWELVWQDEFNDHHLDEDNWIADVNDWGGGNQELQYYVDHSENVYLENGLLNIVGRKDTYLTRDYTSARLNSTRSWTYGRFEVKAKLPEGQGIWPAIWLRSVAETYGPWAASGEIDIMEMLGHEPTVIYGTLHYGSPWPDNEEKQGSTILSSQEFHVFALEWDEDEIRWYVDDVHYLTIDSWYTSGGNHPAPFDQPFNVVLNLAIGGTWPGNPDKNTLFPQKLLIDYVRVYQK